MKSWADRVPPTRHRPLRHGARSVALIRLAIRSRSGSAGGGGVDKEDTSRRRLFVSNLKRTLGLNGRSRVVHSLLLLVPQPSHDHYDHRPLMMIV